MSTYVVLSPKQCRDQAIDGPEFYDDIDDHFPSFLVDTRANVIVWCDRMEPEDATLTRDLRELVDLLNREAAR